MVKLSDNESMRSRFIFTFILLLLATLLFSSATSAQKKRDNLTEMEADLIRDAQQLDLRIDVFVKSIDRRFIVLNNSADANTKQLQKDLEKWGELPKGTQTQLLSDIAQTLDNAINTIDDSAVHDAKNKLIPKATKKLSEACSRFLIQLKPFVEAQNSRTEKAEKIALDRAVEYCESVIEASAKIPDEPKKKGN